MNGPLIALTLQPESDDVTVSSSPLSPGDIALFGTFIFVIVAVFSFDMIRTWWETNQWRREARRRRREIR